MKHRGRIMLGLLVCAVLVGLVLVVSERSNRHPVSGHAGRTVDQDQPAADGAGGGGLGTKAGPQEGTNWAGPVVSPGEVVAADEVAGAGPSVPGRGKHEPMSPAGMLRQSLGLTEEQSKKVEFIFKSQQVQLMALRRTNTLSRTQWRAKYRELHQATDAKLSEILTAEQAQKWQQMRTNREAWGALAPAVADRNTAGTGRVVRKLAGGRESVDALAR